jgi:hypothetical protein
MNIMIVHANYLNLSVKGDENSIMGGQEDGPIYTIKKKACSPQSENKES